jgi:hypothetical protein
MNLRDMFLSDMFQDLIAGNPGEPLRAMLESLIQRTADTPRLKHLNTKDELAE